MAYDTRNPIGSTDPRDLYDNAGNMDKFENGPQPFYPDRFGIQKLSRSGMQQHFESAQAGRQIAFQQFLAGSGFEAPVSYAAGVTLERTTQTFVRDDVQYRIKDPADLPYTLTGNWAAESEKFASMGDSGLRQDLAAPDSEVLVGGAEASAIGALAEAVSVDSDQRLRAASFISGDEALVGATTRDAFVVGRDMTGDTDCHGFADRTVMGGVTDAGTYGAFDCTVQLDGSNNQNHVYSFQDRVTYNGSNVLDHQAGFLSIPKHTGSGNINLRTGVDIRDVNKTGTGTILGNIGVYIRDLISGSSNVALNILQTVGFAIFAPGGAPSYFKGQVRVGGQLDVGALISAQGATGPAVFMHPSATAAYMGATGDYALQLYSNAGVRLEITSSTGSYAVRPGSDATQPLGDASRRWSQVFAASSTISTSDAREKTAVRSLTDNEIAAAKALGSEIGVFRFLSAVNLKGDAARMHIGMTVQRAIEVMEAHGLDPFAYSFICYDEWYGDGDAESGDLYSFRMEGLLAFMMAGLEERLKNIESLIGDK